MTGYKHTWICLLPGIALITLSSLWWWEERDPRPRQQDNSLTRALLRTRAIYLKLGIPPDSLSLSVSQTENLNRRY